MKPVTKILIISTAILYSLFIIHWYLIKFIWPELPEYIPNTPIKINGLIMAAIVLPTYALTGKSVYKVDRQVSVIRLTMLLAIMGVMSEIAFHITKLFWVESDAFFIVKNVAVTSIIYITVGFLTAYQIITKRRAQVWFFIAAFLIIWKLFETYVLSKM